MKHFKFRPDFFYVAVAVYIALGYLLIFTGLDHPILIAFGLVYLFLDRLFVQTILVLLMKGLTVAAAKLKENGSI